MTIKETHDASKKNNDRAGSDRMVELEEQTPGAIVTGEGIATHEAQRSRNPVRPRPGGRVDARQCQTIDRRYGEALKILDTYFGAHNV
jgi:hypothetical protein